MVNLFIILTSLNHAIILQRKVISCQYNKRLLRLGIPSQLEKLIMYFECLVYLMFMCVFVFMWWRMSAAVQTFRNQFLPFTI